MSAQDDDRRASLMARAARFPLELIVIAAVGAFTYGRSLAGCSSTGSGGSTTSSMSASSP